MAIFILSPPPTSHLPFNGPCFRAASLYLPLSGSAPRSQLGGHSQGGPAGGQLATTREACRMLSLPKPEVLDPLDPTYPPWGGTGGPAGPGSFPACIPSNGGCPCSGIPRTLPGPGCRGGAASATLRMRYRRLSEDVGLHVFLH
jgi:hypothetical protein